MISQMRPSEDQRSSSATSLRPLGSDDLAKSPTNTYAFRAEASPSTKSTNDPSPLLGEGVGQNCPRGDNSEWLVTLFYSNYSGNCKALLQFIKNTNIMDKLSIKFVNIDNTTIKKIVLKKFTVVPSMVVIKNDEMSLYSGNNVFEWFNIFMSSLIPQRDISPPRRPSDALTADDLWSSRRQFRPKAGIGTADAALQHRGDNAPVGRIGSASSSTGLQPVEDVVGGSDVPRSTNEAPKTIMEIAAEISKAREN